MAKPPNRKVLVKWARKQAKTWGVPVGVLLAQINQESGFNPKAHSGAGAQGIAQFMPGTWANLIRRYGYHGYNVWNPMQAITVMARYMGSLIKQYGNLKDPLSVYNSGKPWSNGQHIGQTYNYVNSILSNAGQWSSAGASSSGYYHPLPGVSQGRTDEGVDFRPGKGEHILSIGNAIVDFVGRYRGFGTYMAYHLLDGPMAGKEIYVSESIRLLVRKGERLKAGQALAVATGASKGIEMGFAQTGGTYLPLANASYSEGEATGQGKQFANFLGSLSSGGDLSIPGGGGGGGGTASNSMGQSSVPISGGSNVLSGPSASDFGALSSAESTVPGILSPGSTPATATAQQQQGSTWQLLASQPLMDAETAALYRRVQTAGG
jgi:hypothetical protein